MMSDSIVKLLFERSTGRVSSFKRRCLNQQIGHGCSFVITGKDFEEWFERGVSVKAFLEYTLEDTLTYRNFDCIEFTGFSQFNALSAIFLEAAIQQVVCAHGIVIVSSWLHPLNGVTSIISSVSRSAAITKIAFVNCSVKDDDLLDLTENTFVTHFSTRFSEITAQGIRLIVKNFNALRFLDISGCEYDNINEVLAMVAQYTPCIEGLDVSYPAYIPLFFFEQRVDHDKINHIGEDALRNMINLTSLNLGAVKISDRRMASSLGSLKKLQYLYLGYNTMQYPRQIDKFGLGRLTTLTDLIITKPFNFTDGHLLLIANTVGKWLKGFKLDGMSSCDSSQLFRDSGIPVVLRSGISTGSLTSAGFASIGSMQNLQRLCLTNISILSDEIILQHFRFLKNLQQLELSDCRNVTDEAVNQLAAALNIRRVFTSRDVSTSGSYDLYHVLWANQIKIGYEDFSINTYEE
jgi:hypothetical protein